MGLPNHYFVASFRYWPVLSEVKVDSRVSLHYV